MRSAHAAFFGLLATSATLSAACGSSITTDQESSQGGGKGTSTGQATTTTGLATVTTGQGGQAGAVVGTSVATTTGVGGSIVDAGSDVNNGMPSTSYPAPHPVPPNVQDYGGNTMASPQIYPVFFTGDDPAYVAAFTDFVAKVGQGPGTYWSTTTSEYGVGPATGYPAITVPETAPDMLQDSDIQAWLQAKFASATSGFPTPQIATPNTIIAIFYPANTVINLQGQVSCQSFGGYHSAIQVGGATVSYAVMPRCGIGGGLNGIDSVTAAASHEFIEAVTDVDPQNNPAYAQVDEQHYYYAFLAGGATEVGDMCAQNPGAFTNFPPLQYTVQRTWSNASANAGHDPCVPMLPNEVYFNAAAVQPDNVSVNFMGQPISLTGVKIPVGQTRTIDIDLFSDGDTGGPFQVQALDQTQLGMGGGSPLLGLTLDRSSGVNGEILHLTITVNQAGQFGGEVFALVSQLGQTQNYWLGFVGN